MKKMMDKIKKFIHYYSIKGLKTNINEYGYAYTTKTFLLQCLSIIGFTLFIAWINKLKFDYVVILVVISLVLTPFLIYAWFDQLYNRKKFTMLIDYLSNVIPLFMQKTKIRYTLNEVAPLCHGIMQKKIYEAIEYIDNNTDDSDVLKNALGIIEKEFANTRLKSVHKMMLNVEEENSIAYQDVCANMFDDIENWIKRNYSFQKELKNRQNKLLLLCVLTLALNTMFVYLYSTNEYFAGYTDQPLYQISTMLFISAIMIVGVIIITKLHGGWLINDMTRKDEERVKKAYLLIKKGEPSFKKVDILFAIISFVAGLAIIYYKNNLVIALALFGLGYMMLMHNKQKYRVAYKTVNKALSIEFPVWLREVSLSLSTMTVINAIENTYDFSSYPMQQELIKFMEQVKEDPTSIKPFSSFLDDFDLSDAHSSMRVLYSIQNLGRKETKNQVAALILRNQEMLNTAETIQNNDIIMGVEYIGYIPILIFAVQMMCSLIILLTHMMMKMNQAISATGNIMIDIGE